MGKITSKCKGGCIVEHIDTGSLMFLPGSQISDKPLKDISHLMNEPQKFALIKLDKIRGNACVSRREIISSFKKEDKAKIIEKYISYLKTGKCIALISDAGTPLISDPGYEIVKRSKEEQIMVNPIPGPSSVISALIASGLKIDKFIFEGFPPRKANELESYLEKFLFEKRTLVLFESPRRIKKLVQTSLKIFGGKRRVCLAKDISKLHQKFFTGTIEALLNQIEKNKNLEKGEIVFLIEGTKDKAAIDDSNLEILVKSLKAELPLRKISKIASKITKKTSKEIYDTFKKN